LGLCADNAAFQVEGWPHCAADVRRTVLVGVRDLDPGERELLRGAGAPTVFTMADVDRRGLPDVLEEAMSIAAGAGFLHVSCDLDVVDPVDAPGVGTPVRGGLTYREAHTMMETLSRSEVTSIDVVEVNPVLDDANRTGALAAELVASIMGKHILAFGGR
jgi:arginase